MAMFCTNCGEEMRGIDKFCANCGSAAAPRPAKPRAAESAPPEAVAPPPPRTPASVRAPQSTAEAFRAPLPAPSARVASAPIPPLSSQQEQQVFLEAEEIASVRGMLPIDALPPQFPPATRVADTQRCGSCGGANPAGNRYCERCGQTLRAEPADQSAPAPASVRVPPPSSITQTNWLDEPAPARPAIAAPVKQPAATKATTNPAPPATAASGKSDDFFYFYDDNSGQRSNRKLIIVLMVVLALGVLGVIYLLSRPSAKSAPTGNVTVAISPTEAQVVAGEAHDFSATVTGSGDTDVIWSVAEGSGGGNVVNRGAQAQGGSVASLGVYVAPKTPGTYHVVATSKADATKSATAEVVVSGK